MSVPATSIGIIGADPYITPDDRDEAILRDRIAALDARDGQPRCGDYVRFAGGHIRRISHIWRDEQNAPRSIQTSDGGSFYLGDGYVSFSGSLFDGVPRETLTLANERAAGHVWFFHHDWPRAHSAVHASMRFRVYECSEFPP